VRLHPADISRQIRQNVPNLLARESRGPRSGAENRQTSHGIAPDGRFGGSRMVGRKDNLPALHASIKGIARAKSKLAPDGTGKNYLPLAGNAGLHGKSIVPREGLGAQDNCGTAAPKCGAGLHPESPGQATKPRNH
jgi:hypothetical protein